MYGRDPGQGQEPRSGAGDTMYDEGPGQAQALCRAGPKFSCDLISPPPTTPRNSQRTEEICKSGWDEVGELICCCRG